MCIYMYIYLLYLYLYEKKTVNHIAKKAKSFPLTNISIRLCHLTLPPPLTVRPPPSTSHHRHSLRPIFSQLTSSPTPLCFSSNSLRQFNRCQLAFTCEQPHLAKLFPLSRLVFDHPTDNAKAQSDYHHLQLPVTDPLLVGGITGHPL